MNKILTFIFLALISFGAVAQSYPDSTTSRYPEYQRVYEERNECRQVVTEDRYNPGGAIIGGVVGYALGREIDRDRGYDRRGYQYPQHRGYHPGRGAYHRDSRRGGYYYHNDRDNRSGRYAGAVVGTVIGAHVGRNQVVTTVCERVPFYREVLVGYRVVTTYRNGRTTEHFEPVRY